MHSDNKRRHFLKTSLLSSVAASGSLLASTQLLSGCTTKANRSRSQAQWDQEASIIKSAIKRPQIPDRSINIASIISQEHDDDFNRAVHSAIRELSLQGGGKLIIPKGAWFSNGPIHLESNINLHLEAGAIVTFSTDPLLYKPYVYTRWEGMELMGYSPLIYAYQKQNIAITGNGILDGGAGEKNWWPWKGKWKSSTWGDHPTASQKYTRNSLQEMVANGIPVEERVFEHNFLRPPFIQPYACENVLIEGVKILRSPFWLINPVLCKNVTVNSVHCESFGPNSDGCDPESCTNVLIENCTFDTGDDCIAIKSGRNADGRRVGVPSSNIVIENCEMKAGHGGIVIGSEISGGVENLYAQYCRMSSPDLDRGIRIKTNSIRGGLLRNLNYRNIDIGTVKDAVVINYFYEEGDAGNFSPKLEDITIENLHVNVAVRPFVLRGYTHSPIKGVALNDITIVSSEESSLIENVASLTTNNVSVNGAPFSYTKQYK